jgi:hypothetical protein
VLGACLITDAASSTSGSADCVRQAGGALQHCSQQAQAGITCHTAVCSRLRSYNISQTVALVPGSSVHWLPELQLAFSPLSRSPHDQLSHSPCD